MNFVEDKHKTIVHVQLGELILSKNLLERDTISQSCPIQFFFLAWCAIPINLIKILDGSSFSLKLLHKLI